MAKAKTVAETAVAEIVASGDQTHTEERTFFGVWEWDGNNWCWTGGSAGKDSVAEAHEQRDGESPYHILKITLPAI